MSDQLRSQIPDISNTKRILPEISWVSTHPQDWRVYPGALGWGLAHSRWHRQKMLSHLDWFTVTWEDRGNWNIWGTETGIRLFVDIPLLAVLCHFPTVHAIAPPGARVVLRESLLIELRMGCVM